MRGGILLMLGRRMLVVMDIGGREVIARIEVHIPDGDMLMFKC